MLGRIFIGVVVIGSLFFSYAIATQPSIPSLKMEMSIIHDGNWEVGKETQVIFKFKPQQEPKRKTKLPDEALVSFDSSLVLVSGNPAWSGFVEKDQEYMITVVLKPTKAGKFGIRGIVNSCLTKIYTDEELRKKEEEYNKQIEQSPELKKMGMRAKFAKKKFFYHNPISTVVDIPGEIPGPDTSWQEINGVKIRSGPPSTYTVPGIKVLIPNQTDTLKKIDEEKPNDTIKPQKLESSSSFNITGRFRYVNNFGNIEPVKNCQVLLYYWSGLSGWLLDYPDVTNDTGGFFLVTSHTYVKLELRSFNSPVVDKAAGLIFKTDGHFDTGDDVNMYLWPITIDGISGDVQVPDVNTTITNPDIAGAFELANDILTGYNYVYAVTGYFFPPRLEYVYWDPIDYSVSTGYGKFIIQSSNTPGIIIQGRETFYQRDEWDPQVVVHEYGHFIMDEYAEKADSAGGPHVYHAPPSGSDQIDRRVAYSEGWANFFQAAVWGAPALENRDNNDNFILKINLERPEPDVPYIDSLDFDGEDQLVPSQSQPVYFAYDVEGSVTEALWDIFDFSNDDYYLIGPDTFGHNNDHNQSDSWRDITAIWDVFWNYDPAPADPGHNHVRDFFEFIRGWGASDYPILGNFSKICNSHALYIKRGDANFDTKILLTDEVFLINYVFKTGPAPLTVCNGDATNDGIINLSDIVYLNNYIFKSGPAPTPALC